MACVKCKQEILKLLREQNRLLQDLIQRFDIGEDVDQEYCDLVRDIDIQNSQYPLLQLKRVDLSKHYAVPLVDK
jgi:hypothetical protein